MYMQAWPGISSTEMRLRIKRRDLKNLIYYPVNEIENKYYWYNNVRRSFFFHKNPNADRKIGFCHCSDCAMENKIWTDYGYDAKEVKKAVVHMGKIANGALTKVHKYNIWEVPTAASLRTKVDMKVAPPKVFNFGNQRGNIGRN